MVTDEAGNILDFIREKYVLQKVALMTMRHHVDGYIVQVGTNFIRLDEATNLMISGRGTASQPETAEAIEGAPVLGRSIYIMGHTIEMLWQPNWCLEASKYKFKALNHDIDIQGALREYINERIAVMCARYHYVGELAEVVGETMAIKNPWVAETYDSSKKGATKRMDRVPSSVIINMAFIERIWAPAWLSTVGDE